MKNFYNNLPYKKISIIFIPILLVLTYLIFFYDNSNYETTTSYYVNGLGVSTEQKKSITNYKDGLKHGLETSFYIDGTIALRENYKEGVIDGDIIEYFENGNIKVIGKAKDGKPDGENKLYYENGAIKEIVNLKNGELNGDNVLYYENGKVEAITNLKNGELDGVGIIYDEDGNKKRERNYKDGVRDGRYKYFYQNSNLQLELNFSKGKLTELVSYKDIGGNELNKNIEDLKLDCDLDNKFYDEGSPTESNMKHWCYYLFVYDEEKSNDSTQSAQNKLEEYTIQNFKISLINTLGSYAKIGYRFDIRNNSNIDTSPSIYITFLDKDGFKIEEDFEYIDLDSISATIVSGNRLIDKELLSRIEFVNIEIDNKTFSSIPFDI